MPESQARRLVLAQAIDTLDTTGKLVSPAKRAQIELAALQKANADKPAGQADQRLLTRRFLDNYASGIIDAVGEASADSANRRLAALQTGRGWLRVLAIATPLLALLLGMLTDQIANPHRVDLLSAPLLAVVVWNLAMYSALLVQWLLSLARKPSAAGDRTSRLQQWGEDSRQWLQRRQNLQTRITAAFYAQWHLLTAALSGQRLRRVLHLSAAAWALGLALSLLSRGLVVEYRAGWESTFLSAAQVHWFLNLLFSPVVALLPVMPFSIEEVASLRFDAANADSGANSGARWAWMYAGLFLLVVVLPRLALAAAASWRIRELAQNIALDLGQPYFQKLVASVLPARIRLGLLSHRDADRALMMGVLVQGAAAPPAGLHNLSLMKTAYGDELLLSDLSLSQQPAALPALARPSGFARLQNSLGRLPQLLRLGGPGGRPAPARPEQVLDAGVDVVLHMVRDKSDLAASAAFLRVLQRPQLILLDERDLAALSNADESGTACKPITLQSFALCWVQEPALFAMLQQLLPASQQPGLARITAAWQARNHARFAGSLEAISRHLLQAAALAAEVPDIALKSRLFKSDDRKAHLDALEQAKARLASQVEQSAAGLYSELAAQHGLRANAALELQQTFEKTAFVPHYPESQQALVGTTGAAAGAAAGASIGAHLDILTLGATLGAGAALGALLGGGGALAALVWRTRSNPNGRPLVQFSDEMMQAMTESSLLRYLAVAHFGRQTGAMPATDLQDSWKRLLHDEAVRHEAELAMLWQAARTGPDAADHEQLHQKLSERLETVAVRVLRKLHPDAANGTEPAQELVPAGLTGMGGFWSP